jgi:hypothetical protein
VSKSTVPRAERKKCIYSNCERPVRFHRPESDEFEEAYFCLEHTPKWRRDQYTDLGEAFEAA